MSFFVHESAVKCIHRSVFINTYTINSLHVFNNERVFQKESIMWEYFSVGKLNIWASRDRGGGDTRQNTLIFVFVHA